ncbi:hypothetical protein [Nocardia sp. NPDC020380]|uniref:hypothetical protein n=1 Tax=Nocardia sp. NPDC020380 TaxID=3364309 RepID=UPI0037A554BF
MSGKVLDFVAIAAFSIVLLCFAMFDTGLPTAIAAWLGLVCLGYYNVFVRHDRKLVDATHANRPFDHSTTLRAGRR